MKMVNVKNVLMISKLNLFFFELMGNLNILYRYNVAHACAICVPFLYIFNKYNNKYVLNYTIFLLLFFFSRNPFTIGTRVSPKASYGNSPSWAKNLFNNPTA